MNILIDAFGGDNAPLEVIRGGARAVQELGVTVTLVGDEQKIRACAEKNRLPLDGMEILHAPAVFDIHEEPSTLPASSVRQWLRCSPRKRHRFC